MAASRSWLPQSRTGQLEMSGAWKLVLGVKAVDWNVPNTSVLDFIAAIAGADSALSEAKNESTRTPVATAKCKAAFDILVEIMRDIKRRYFLSPPLTNADFISLGLSPHDTTFTPIGAPTAQVSADTFLIGRHELGIRIFYITGDPDAKANKGYRIWYKVAAQDEEAITDPEQLPKSFFTKRQKDIIELDYGDSGKKLYFAIQIENEGKKGPWGPIVEAIIP